MSDTLDSATRWASRTSIPASTQNNNSLVFGGDPAPALVGISLDELQQLRSLSAATWALTPVKASDRVLVSTLQNGGFPVATAVEVLAPLCKAVSYASPKGRLRLLHTMKQFKPTVWVTTPCAALDFLARLYMEFNIDPFELGIEKIILVGEVASPGTHKRLADEFESSVTDLYCDPLFGAALAARIKGEMHCGETSIVGLASLDENSLIANGWQADTKAEIVLRYQNIQALNGLILRTGHVVDPEQAVGCFHHTIGDQVLARGQWLHLSLFRKALKLIDGLQAWQLIIERGEGTLDRITLKMGLNRESLVANPMWQARIRESVASVTPLKIQIETYFLTADDPQPGTSVDDHRGHHLGGDRGFNEQVGWQS